MSSQDRGIASEVGSGQGWHRYGLCGGAGEAPRPRCCLVRVLLTHWPARGSGAEHMVRLAPCQVLVTRRPGSTPSVEGKEHTDAIHAYSCPNGFFPSSKPCPGVCL